MSTLSGDLSRWVLTGQRDLVSPKARQVDLGDVLFKLSIVLASIAAVWAAAAFRSHVLGYRMLWSTWPGRAILISGGLYGGVATYWTIWRLYLALRYKPCPTVERHRLPRITVVVPAYNEGPLVAKTLRNLVNCDYPTDRMEIIVVDDGSEDDTWEHIRRETETAGGRITALHFDQNRGKRHALYEGIRRATGEVLVTVDSDSLVAADGLAALVSPLVVDPGLGAVAGNVRVLNREGGLIPRMLAVRYVMTFDYKRAAQSMMGGGTVLCVAGALAAYRRSAVMPVLDAWLHQRYLGGQARAGEDHAMTNFVIKQGYTVRYQRTARVQTQSPTTYAGLAKMFLRWGRSNVRETLHTGSYVFGPFRSGPQLAIRFNFIMCALGLWVPYLFLSTALVLSVIYPTIFGLKMLAACATGGAFSLLFFAARERTSEAILAIVYSFYSLILLGWVWPWALLTSHKSVWMTRTPKAGVSTLAVRRAMPDAAASTARAAAIRAA